MSSSTTTGLLLVDKAAGMTSHDVVARARRALDERRIGHGGTLDPDATGLLVCAVGRATRLLRYVSALDKAYVGEVVLGVATDSLDASGTEVARFEMGGVTLADVSGAASGFVGTIEQVPPMVSAVRVGGRRLYELARAGEEIERAPRRVTISRLEVAPTPAAGVFWISLDCSSGTYVRQLAGDLGAALGGGAHLRNLRRVRIGPFGVAEAVAIEDVVPSSLRPVSELVAHLEQVLVDDELAPRLCDGAICVPGELGESGEGPYGVSTAAGRFLGVWVREGARVRPEVVLTARAELDGGSPR